MDCIEEHYLPLLLEKGLILGSENTVIPSGDYMLKKKKTEL